MPQSPELDALALATLCDMVLGESAMDRSNDALIRRVRYLLNAVQDAQWLLTGILKDDVNAMDEAEKWLRAYGNIYKTK